ncbi:MAG TPA: APC family permease [Vicinamibacteria bacterium]|nr:APC family permease [Vicinamibacteria bacterium]
MPDKDVENKSRKHTTAHKRGGLKELPATAICGNDITSSCLYVSALAIIAGGKWAWISLLIVAAVLFLFRGVYAEVVGALPLNGGAYNALLNTTSKRMASVAACLTVLSYMATAVISASEAMHYAHALWERIPVIPATVALMAVFMVLTILGIQESSRVAVFIFLFHLSSLTLLLGVGLLSLMTQGLEVFAENMARPTDSVSRSLFFGFAAAMLGISGFESSANFVEEQAEGVFPKTLRNMWAAVSFFNPAMALLALALVPIGEVPGHRENLLAHMGGLAGGGWLSWLVSVDAVLVLSGAVLTSFIGVTGLVRRMTLDRVLPQFFLKTNRRGTAHRIIFAFFLLSASILFITGGDIEALAGVYTISFLAVMALFGLGNVLLKTRRSRLPRPSRVSWPIVLVGIAAVFVGLAGNIIMHPAYFRVFLAYFIPSLLVALVMLGRIGILKVCLFFVRRVSETVAGITNALATAIRGKMDEINAQQVVFFTRGESLHNLNEAMLYVRNNEHTNRIKVVTVVQDEKEVPARLERDLKFLDEAYPEIDIEFVVEKGEFGPKLIKKLSKEWKIPTNFMFIASPGDHFLFGLAELGGVRLII